MVLWMALGPVFLSTVLFYFFSMSSVIVEASTVTGKSYVCRHFAETLRPIFIYVYCVAGTNECFNDMGGYSSCVLAIPI